MGDLGVLENLVANTAYLKAQQMDRTELRKQRLTLSLPKPKNLSSQDAVVKKYESLCEQQPIGKKLFQQFLLTSNPQYMVAATFLEELGDWDYAEGISKNIVQKRIFTKFCQSGSSSFLSCLTGAGAATLKNLSDENFEELIGELKNATIDFLKGKPFLEYLDSPFFYKFLQWKEYESQKISDKYFYEFRTLGRGGFGEVGVLHCWLLDLFKLTITCYRERLLPLI